MLTRIRRPVARHGRRRGVTLVEMLVVVALVVLMMTILVQIFQQATGAISISRTTADLDVNLRQLDSIIRSDLAGTTAKMTPPNDPKDKRGYFEYIENAAADAQGEDTDDCLAFTTKAAEGEVFTGRQWLGSSGSTINQRIQPTTITSQVAEVIYFLRNGNLYRRVLLVAPDRNTSLTRGTILAGFYGAPTFGPYTQDGLRYYKDLFGANRILSWLGMNSISSRPNNSIKAGTGSSGAPLLNVPIPNTLGDLVNRENRAFRPRFINDFSSSTGASNADGIPDDNNADGVPDYYPTLYFNGSDDAATHRLYDASGATLSGWTPNGKTNEKSPYGTFSRVSQDYTGATNTYPFPYIYPGMYSKPGDSTTNPKTPSTIRFEYGLGWVHEMYPVPTNGSFVINHSPLLPGDNLPVPPLNSNQTQTWWGFPTWRETMSGYTGSSSVGWTDPMLFLYPQNSTSTSFLQPLGLQPNPANALPSANPANLLPPLLTPGTTSSVPFADTAGSASFVVDPVSPGSTQQVNPTAVWEDDLLQTNVRSFDVKAYDPDAALYSNGLNGFFTAGYQDLGYGSTYFDKSGVTANSGPDYNYVGGPNGLSATSQSSVFWQAVSGEPTGFGHEGRIPPLPTDFRMHPRRGYNIGDPSLAVQRLVRVWDSWSTDYTNAPDFDVFLNQIDPSTAAIYPSFPAPYPSPLRGIQIQIRLADPRNERVKSITIRHDFTDKL